ncbi:hypothetical protein NC652_009600 [Populus alba x Populus x berolinensis]|nr:hypothetical protein NC652_009600 [Populus alba x Populus x berolinensis]
MQPSALPIQILRVGQLAILSVPGVEAAPPPFGVVKTGRKSKLDWEVPIA